MDIQEQLLDTWEIHNRIVLYVLAAISPEALSATSTLKGRNAGQVLAHIHNNRLAWLEAAAPELMGTPHLDKIPKEEAGAQKRLRAALEASGPAIKQLLMNGIKAGKIKGFKPHPVAFIGYLISHESYHLGEVGIILAQSGHPLDKQTAYGMWEWGKR